MKMKTDPWRAERKVGAGLLAVLVAVLAALCLLSGCANEPVEMSDDYVNTAEARGSVTFAVDDLGRKTVTAKDTESAREGKYVGIFYFLWQGEHGTDGPYDNSVIEKTLGSTASEANWIAAGGGPEHAHHFWGKPLFDYYVASDKWVMRKHIQMLCDAGIDFVVFDTTNSVPYIANALAFMQISHEYREAGFNAPQVVFYTNSASGKTMKKIYHNIYKAHPELSDTWFCRDGKPLIVGNKYDSDLGDEAKEFFSFKDSQWPNEFKNDNGFPWMEFGRLLTDDAVYGLGKRKEIVNVSAAQHCDTIRFSATAWYGGNDHTRSWHDGAIDRSENAYLYGYNIAEQYEWALGVDPEIVFITGWNEWVAQRQPGSYDQPVVFVDCCDVDGSRDLEPMEGGFFDNYYMQMISFIRKFKGVDADTSAVKKTIDVNGGFAQWNGVEACYKDYENDVVDRDWFIFGNTEIKDTSGRNDISEMKVCEDRQYVYFFVKTVDNITEPGEDWMRLFIGTYGKGRGGFDYCVNYKTPDKDGKLYVGMIVPGDGDYEFTDAGEADYRVKDNMMMLRVKKSTLGIFINANIVFKWADNCGDNVESFYTQGDAAPIGRAGYCYGNR